MYRKNIIFLLSSWKLCRYFLYPDWAGTNFGFYSTFRFWFCLTPSFGTCWIHFWCGLRKLIEYLKATHVAPSNFWPDTHTHTHHPVVQKFRCNKPESPKLSFSSSETVWGQHFLCHQNFCCFLLTADRWQLMCNILKIPIQHLPCGKKGIRGECSPADI